VSLVEDLIVGPFEFSQVRIPMQGPKHHAVSEHNRIETTYWDILVKQANQFGIDGSSIRSLPMHGHTMGMSQAQSM
jgi:hypothetical protein